MPSLRFLKTSVLINTMLRKLDNDSALLLERYIIGIEYGVAGNVGDSKVSDKKYL